MGPHDSSNFEARTSVDHRSNESKEYGETRSGNVDFRIQGLPHSTVPKQDDVRTKTVKKLIHQFETHPNRELLTADLDNNQIFNPSSEKSKETRSTSRSPRSFLKYNAKIACYIWK